MRDITTLTAQERASLNLLRIYTAGRYDIWMLAGGPRASSRSHVMSALRGERVPQSKAGVTAIREAFYSMAQVEPGCLNAQEEQFVEWARHVDYAGRNEDDLRPAGKAASQHTPPTCQRCGAMLSAVTWTCVRGEYCGVPFPA
jgi:hypothetical protein